MDVPDGDPLCAKTNDALTASISSEDFGSWTVLERGADKLEKEPSGVQIVKTEENEEDDNLLKEAQSKRKQSMDSQPDESSDGISVISESDVANYDKLTLAEGAYDDHCGGIVHFRFKLHSKLPDPDEPLTPPYTPDEETPQLNVAEKELQVQYTVDKSVETALPLVQHRRSVLVTNASWMIFSVVATAMAAIIIGNSMRLQHRVDEINFEHEKRISELELENNILKNEMNKLRHLYTRSELDEQVQRAEFEWMELLRNEAGGTISIAVPHPEEDTVSQIPSEPQLVRKVPPQDVGVERKVVWTGDDEEPMLIVDKDYVLPAFCYSQEQAVQDDLFSEYSAKYCNVRKRKIETKQKNAKFHQKRQSKQESYDKFIHPNPAKWKAENSASVDSSRVASPFNIDYKKAFDAIKAEGTVIVDVLSSILDLSPEPEEMLKVVPENLEKITVEVVSSSAVHFPNQQNALFQNDRHNHYEVGKNQPEGNGNGKEESVAHNKRDDYENRRGFNEGQEHRKHGSDANDRVDKKERKKTRKHLDGDGEKISEDIRKRHKIDDEVGRQSKKYTVDHDGSKYFLENQGQHDHGRNDYHNVKHQDQIKMRYDQREQDKGGRQQRYSSDEGSHLNQYKQKRSGRSHDGNHVDKHKKQHQIYHDQQKHSEWREKRSKGREEFRQKNDGRQGDWHENRSKKREEYRQKGGKLERN